MADYSQLMNLEKQQKKHPLPSSVQQPTSQPSTTPSTEQSSAPLIHQLIDQSIVQSMNQSTTQSIRNTSNKVMEKPRGFYITERLNQHIDEAVRYYQEKHNLKKVDRSIVVTVLLENEANWTEEALDLLLDKIIHQLTRRLTNR
jgi:hypothetical protein